MTELKMVYLEVTLFSSIWNKEHFNILYGDNLAMAYITMGGCTTIQRYPLLTLLHKLNNAKLSTLTRTLSLFHRFRRLASC